MLGLRQSGDILRLESRTRLWSQAMVEQHKVEGAGSVEICQRGISEDVSDLQLSETIPGSRRFVEYVASIRVRGHSILV